MQAMRFADETINVGVCPASTDANVALRIHRDSPHAGMHQALGFEGASLKCPAHDVNATDHLSIVHRMTGRAHQSILFLFEKMQQLTVLFDTGQIPLLLTSCPSCGSCSVLRALDACGAARAAQVVGDSLGIRGS
jgi:hypothetical protein